MRETSLSTVNTKLEWLPRVAIQQRWHIDYPGLYEKNLKMLQAEKARLEAELDAPSHSQR